MRYEAGKFTHLAAPALLPHSNVLSIFEDAEGDTWVGTQGGLERLSPSVATTVTTSDGTLQSINTVYQDPRGELLVAGLNGRLFRVHNQVAMSLSSRPDQVESRPVPGLCDREESDR